jgi:hypothetical protein
VLAPAADVPPLLSAPASALEPAECSPVMPAVLPPAPASPVGLLVKALPEHDSTSQPTNPHVPSTPFVRLAQTIALTSADPYHAPTLVLPADAQRPEILAVSAMRSLTSRPARST